MVVVALSSRRRRVARLDPATDYAEIHRNTVLHEFPWDMEVAAVAAQLRTLAVPRIGGLLARTGEFRQRPRKRYDDTALLMEVPLVEGLDSVRGRTAFRRINEMHAMHDIADDDLRYALATQVVVPARWIARHGWRALTRAELEASIRYHRDVARRMHVGGLPTTYADLAALVDQHEREHFGHDPGAREVADALLHLVAGFGPAGTHHLVHAAALALMDAPLREALGYPDPGPGVRRATLAALRTRARTVALLPARRRPRSLVGTARGRSYPAGFRVDRLGTFAPTCPVHRHSPEPPGRTAAVD
ncbi:DUF2236 domain-containing protein [Nocardioides sp. ChNu-99]|nr:DUF2236 domain-containing protein [Nocardioides sp. ChNu-99]